MPMMGGAPGMENAGLLYVNPSVLPTHNTRVKMRQVDFEHADADGKCRVKHFYLVRLAWAQLVDRRGRG